MDGTASWTVAVPAGRRSGHGATQAGLGLTTNLVVAAAMLFASSAAWALFNMTAVTMRQRQVPPRMLGRVTSLYGTVAGGYEALGALGGGALAAHCRDPRPQAHRRRADRCGDNPARMAPSQPRRPGTCVAAL
jgi:hypothetical protein